MQGPTPELNLKMGHTMVRAGAGAGKTHGLVERVVEVYRTYRLKTGRAPRVVLTTFTRKATQELKERLILRACRDKDAELLQFVSDPSLLHISTIHGLLSIFLKQVGHLAGLDSGFQIISETEGTHLARLALREAVVANTTSLRWLELYSFERVLRMCRRFENLQREQGPLTPASLSDMEALAARIGQDWARRFDHLIQEIESSVDEKSWQNYAQGLRDFVASWRGGVPNSENIPRKPPVRKDRTDLEAINEAVGEVVGKFKAEMEKPGWQADLWPALAAEWVEFQELAQEFSRQLSAIKETQARFEMSDLELKTLEILRAKPFLGAVFAESWDYWMIDEYQDTSPLQVEVLEALIGERDQYLVGDPQQSIYLFRGAEVGVFRDAQERIRNKGGENIELVKNYRSNPELLAWINDFMQTIGPEFVRMQARDTDANATDPCVLLWHAPDTDTELKGVAARIAELLNQGARLEQICVLGRTHRNLMQVSRALKSYGYPTHVHAARGFALRREVLDAQALWKFLLNPHDGFNLILLLRSPWFNVSDADISEWMKERPTSLWRRLMHMENVPDAIARLRACIQHMEKEGVVRAFEQGLLANAYLDLSLNEDPAGRKESNLWKLIHRAQSLEREGGESLLALLQSEGEDPMEANEGDATSAQEPNSINLMTIHGAKGLEFDHVIVTAMGEAPLTSKTEPLSAEGGRFFFPAWQESAGEFVASLLDQDSVRRLRTRELEEFDRWLYVALTRAKKTLTLSWSETPRDESWASRSAWFLKKPGLHQTPHYTVELVEKMPEPQMYREASNETKAVREPFTDLAEEKEARHSVTELVAREIHVKPRGDDLLKRWQAQNAGIRIHRALEALKYQASTETSDSSDDSIRFVLELQNPPLAEWIRGGETEWGFHVQTARGVLEGQIDLWTKHDGKIYVVDYKTGSPTYQESAFRQLSLYAWALRRFGHDEPAELVVIYPHLKKVERRAFTKELFLSWENVLGVAETAR